MAGSLKNRYQDVLGQAHTFLKSGNRHVANLGSKERKEHAEKVGAQCPICGARITARASNEDHILPRNLGGTNDKHNRVLMCFGCNTFRDQVQRIAFGAQGPNAAREIYKVDPERIDSFILWLQVTVDEGIVAGAAYEETQSTNSIFAEMGGSNQPNIPIDNRLGRYSEWEPKIGSHSEMLETKSTEHPKSMIDSDSSDGGEVEMAEIISSTPFEYEREIRQGIIQILRDNRGTGEPMIVGAFGIEFNRMTRENNFPPRKAINQSLGLRSSATISELLDRLFGDEISYIERSPDSFYIVRRQNWKDSFRTWWRRVTELLGRIWRPNQRHVNEPVDGDQLEIPTTEPEEVDSEPVLNDIIGTEGDPIEKFLRSLSGQTVEISYLGRLLSDAFPKELGTPRQWLKEHGHGLSKPFGRILSESYSHLIDEEIQHGSTILYVIGDAESIEEISDESGNMPIPHFNSARGFLMPKNPDDVASILIAFEACRGEEFVYGEAIDHLRPNLEQPVARIVGVIVRLRELLGITIDDDIDWDSIPTPEELLIKLKDQFNENWIPIGNHAGKIPADSVTAYFSQAFEHLGSKSRVSVKPPSSALDWLKTNTLEIMNSADGEWVNQAWFTNALNSRAEKSPYGSRQKLFVSLDFKAKESVRTVLENIMGELIQFEQVEPTYWRARLA